MKNKVMKKVLMIMLSATMLIGSASVTAFAQANENAEQAETAEQVIEEQPTEQPATEGTPFSTPGNGQLVDDKENDSSKQFLTVQTKNHFFFRESGPELQTFFFELIFQLKFYLFKQIAFIWLLIVPVLLKMCT